jgi:hypothetical protein
MEVTRKDFLDGISKSHGLLEECKDVACYFSQPNAAEGFRPMASS